MVVQPALSRGLRDAFVESHSNVAKKRDVRMGHPGAWVGTKRSKAKAAGEGARSTRLGLFAQGDQLRARSARKIVANK